MKYLPPIGGGPDDPYVDAAPAVGEEGSIPPAAAIEHPMREIIAVIEAAGLVPDSGDLTQLGQAIAALIVAGVGALPDGLAYLAAAQAWTKGQRSAPVAINDAAPAIDLAASNVFHWTLSGNRTLPLPASIGAGQSGVIWLVQDATGGRTLAFNAVWKFGGGTLPVLSTGAGAIDLLVYETDPTGAVIAAALIKGIG